MEQIRRWRQSVKNAEKNETSVRKTGLSKEGRESSSGNIRHCACNAHSELCEGGARVSKKVMNPSHLWDGLSAEASEGIGGDSLYVAVVLQFTKSKTHD